MPSSQQIRTSGSSFSVVVKERIRRRHLFELRGMGSFFPRSLICSNPSRTPSQRRGTHTITHCSLYMFYKIYETYLMSLLICTSSMRCVSYTRVGRMWNIGKEWSNLGFHTPKVKTIRYVCSDAQKCIGVVKRKFENIYGRFSVSIQNGHDVIIIRARQHVTHFVVTQTECKMH